MEVLRAGVEEQQQEEALLGAQRANIQALRGLEMLPGNRPGNLKNTVKRVTMAGPFWSTKTSGFL